MIGLMKRKTDSLKKPQNFTILLLIKLVFSCYATNKGAQAGTHIPFLLQLPSNCRCGSGDLCNLHAPFNPGSGEGQCRDLVRVSVGGRESEGRWLQQMTSLPLGCTGRWAGRGPFLLCWCSSV